MVIKYQFLIGFQNIHVVCSLFVTGEGGEFPKYLLNINPRKKLRGKSNEHLLQFLRLARS